MTFLHPALIALPVLLLIGVPLVIHLIHLLRYRRVKWAAMEFLLASQKKNRTRVWMTQLLLLLARMAVVATVILLVAGAILTGDWTRVFSGGQTHHIVLVDDTPSMSARGGGVADFERARQVAGRLASQMSAADTPQSLSLITMTRAAYRAWDPEQELVRLSATDRKDFDRRVAEAVGALSPTQLSVEPLAALEGIASVLSAGAADERRVLHLVTDFRAAQWREAAPLSKRLAELADAGVQLHLVQCATPAEPNVAVTRLEPEKGVRAAGVPLAVELGVTNFGQTAVRDVVVNIETTSGGEGARLDDAASWSKLPAVKIDAIKPGETAARRFYARFTAAGHHALRASLEGDFLSAHDSLPDDNVRYAVAPITLDSSVLVIDGNPQDDDARIVATALRPGGTTRTGVSPQVQPPTFLRGRSLDEFAAIFLLDVGSLEQSVIEALESYVKAGGGVVFFMGQAANRATINAQLYRDGQGLFPAPILGPLDLPEDPIASRSDVQFEKGGLLDRLAAATYQNIPVRIARYIALDRKWQTDAKSPTRIVARLRGGAPLILERSLGRGRVVAVLSTAGRDWNEWSTAFTFPIFMQELAGQLSAGRQTDDVSAVGSPIEVALPANRFAAGAKATLRTPYGEASPMAKIAATIESAGGELARVTVGKDNYLQTALVGVYELQVTARDGANEVRRVARVTAPGESDLATLDGRQLAETLPRIEYVLHTADEVQRQAERVAGVNISPWVFAGLAALLVVEQVLAFVCSYHPPRVAAAK
jgi:hypothetical protein